MVGVLGIADQVEVRAMATVMVRLGNIDGEIAQILFGGAVGAYQPLLRKEGR